MPIYEYQCQACNHKEDIIQKFSDPPETRCPQCGKDTLHKNMSAPSFQLTGGGWYATDYKDKKPTTTETTKEDAKPAAAENKENTAATAETKNTTVEKSKNTDKAS